MLRRNVKQDLGGGCSDLTFCAFTPYNGPAAAAAGGGGCKNVQRPRRGRDVLVGGRGATGIEFRFWNTNPNYAMQSANRGGWLLFKGSLARRYIRDSYDGAGQGRRQRQERVERQ